MAFDPSSRARLTRRSAHHFDQDSLFHALGRAVCEAECLPRKELFEAWEVARRVRRRFRGGVVVDAPAGHGLLAWILLLLDDTSPHAVCVDRRRPKSAGRLDEVLARRWPRLAGRIRYAEQELEALELEPGSLLVSIHACGRLTDQVLDLAIGAGVRAAVLPCCQDVSTCDTGSLEGWLEGRLAVDVTRVHRLRAAGFTVRTQQIPAEITPMNRLLLAEPAQTTGAGPP